MATLTSIFSALWICSTIWDVYSTDGLNNWNLFVQHSFINSTCMKVLWDTKHNMRTYYKQKAICNFGWIKSISFISSVFFPSFQCHSFLFSDLSFTFHFLSRTFSTFEALPSRIFFLPFPILDILCKSHEK